MRYNIAQHASNGGIARNNKLTQQQRTDIARKGATASNKRYEQARASEDNSATKQSEYDRIVTKLAIVNTFLRSKGTSIDDIIESTESYTE